LKRRLPESERLGFPQEGAAMKKKSRKGQQRKDVPEIHPVLRTVEVGNVEVQARAKLRDVLIHGGLAVATAMLEEEVERLCGPRYSRGEGLASRWGHGPGEAVLGGRRVALERPRVREGKQEVALETYQHFQAEDPLTERAMEQMLVGVSTRKYARSLEPLVAPVEESGTSKSAVSRRFVAKTEAQLEVTLSESLRDRNWVGLMVDGLHFHEHLILILLGIDETGEKHLLGFREGTTENETVCRELLADAVARGVPADRSILVVIDGGKGLRAAVTNVFGQYALVQRCRVHKRRNVLEHLPEGERGQARAAMNEAYKAKDYETGLRLLQNLARTLDKKHPSAAASLREGMEETLTVTKLGLAGALCRTLETTNAIENLNGGVRRVGGRVKRCRDGRMALRWVVTAAIEAARTFRRLRGHRDIPKLIAVLRARDAEMNRTNVRPAV
jgi:transposase-like protein